MARADVGLNVVNTDGLSVENSIKEIKERSVRSIIIVSNGSDENLLSFIQKRELYANRGAYRVHRQQ